MMSLSKRTELLSKYEINCADQTKGGVEKIPIQRHFHKINRKHTENHHSDHFLDDFQLWKSEIIKSNSVGGYLKTVLQ